MGCLPSLGSHRVRHDWSDLATAVAVAVRDLIISCFEPVYIRKLSLGDTEGQGSLTCRSPWGPKESDTTEQLNNNKTRKQSLNSRISTSFYIKTFLWCVITKGCWKMLWNSKGEMNKVFLMPIYMRKKLLSSAPVVKEICSLLCGSVLLYLILRMKTRFLIFF